MWIKIDEYHLPPEGVEVLTKIVDESGSHNIQTLIRRRNLFFDPNNGIYVYYAPTHFCLEKN